MNSSPTRPEKPLILNVDDDEPGRYARRRTLERAGFDVVDAGFGQEAIDKIEALKPVLVVLDVHLPDMNGLDVCKRIKALAVNVMVLQTSATFITAADRSRGLEGGADAYLIEPIDPTELVATVRALLRLHTAENELRVLNQHLEARVQERTERLNKAHLQLIGQMAKRERAEEVMSQARHMEAVGQTATAAASELLRLFAAVSQTAQRCKEFPESRQAGLDAVMEQAERGSALCRRLLQYSESVEEDLQPLDVVEVIAGMSAWMRRSAGHGVSLPARSQPMLAITDANRLELALFDLVRRVGAGVGPHGQVVVSVQERDAEGDLPAGRYVVIGVAGRRGGAAVAAAAEDSSDRLEDWARHNARQAFSTGHIAGGTIRQGDAAEESIELWLPAADPAAFDLRLRALEPAERASVEGCVLVVDDDRDERAAVRLALQGSGMAVVAAGSSIEALALARRLPTALLVADFAMPGMSGVELLNQLRQDQPNLPVIFMRAPGEGLDVAVSLAAAAMVSKPIDADELVALVRAMLAR